MLMTTPKKMSTDITKLLLYPNIMIADTRETYDTTPHKTRCVNLKDTTEEYSIQ